MTPDKIRWAMSSGYNLACATCIHLHTALVSEKTGCGKVKCGGPIYNKTFPEYSGILTKHEFLRLCLVCSSQDLTHFVVVKGKKAFGLCKDHYKALDDAIDTMTLKDSTAKGSGVSKPLIIGAFDV